MHIDKTREKQIIVVIVTIVIIAIIVFYAHLWFFLPRYDLTASANATDTNVKIHVDFYKSPDSYSSAWGNLTVQIRDVSGKLLWDSGTITISGDVYNGHDVTINWDNMSPIPTHSQYLVAEVYLIDRDTQRPYATSVLFQRP